MILVCLMFGLTSAHVAVAQDKVNKEEKRAAKIKEGINKLGVDKYSKVTIKLKDKTKVRGTISEITDDTFTIIDQAGNEQVIKYTEAKAIKGNNVPAGVWIAVGVGAGLGVFALAILYAISKN